MCGIFGIFSSQIDPAIALQLNSKNKHRGPDAQEGKLYRNNSLFLGHCRLSILDLSEAGSQPMTSHNGKYSLTYNGEIYNYAEIRSVLNRNWRGHSDTEVLLEAICEWGIEKTLSKIKGMFSIALFDHAEEMLFLIRDRMGEKPLYYGSVQGSFVFSSELKSIMAYPGFKNEISNEALAGFFSYSCVPQDLSIFKEIHKLKPAHILEYHLPSKALKITKYWDIFESYNNKLVINETDAINELERLLEQSISSQMISDVPLGAFLSGGVDSSAIVAIMQKLSTKKVKTFSIGFNEKKYNEAEYAKAVAAHLQTDHTELYVSPQDALNVVPKLADIYDEPFADSSQIPTYLLAKMTSKHVKVSLSGDAGDELFGGYNRYLLAEKIKKANSLMPGFAAKTVSKGLSKVPDSLWNKINGISSDKIFKLRRVLGVNSDSDVYDILVRHWGRDLLPLKENINYPGNTLTSNGTFAERMMVQDCLTYLPDDILVKVDRAAMANSLETRVPFLDKDVVEFAMRLPVNLKIASSSKYILRKVLYKHVPSELIERPKMGFGIPVDVWLKNDLKDWANDLLSERNLNTHNLLNTTLIRKMWKDHLNNTANWQHYLWDVLMFQSWYFRYMKKV